MAGNKPKVSAGADPAVKEKIFSLIRKLEEEGITDGRRPLWVWFNDVPHVLLKRAEDGYVLLLWRDCVVVKITLDHEFNVTGFDVDVGP
jgi:hypothetical protein